MPHPSHPIPSTAQDAAPAPRYLDLPGPSTSAAQVLDPEVHRTRWIVDDEAACTCGLVVERSTGSTRALAAALLGAVVTLHAGGVVHRDPRRAHVVLTPTGAQLVDLGAAIARTSTTELAVRVRSAPLDLTGLDGRRGHRQRQRADVVPPRRAAPGRGVTGAPPAQVLLSPDRRSARAR